MYGPFICLILYGRIIDPHSQRAKIRSKKKLRELCMIVLLKVSGVQSFCCKYLWLTHPKFSMVHLSHEKNPLTSIVNWDPYGVVLDNIHFETGNQSESMDWAKLYDINALDVGIIWDIHTLIFLTNNTS